MNERPPAEPAVKITKEKLIETSNPDHKWQGEDYSKVTLEKNGHEVEVVYSVKAKMVEGAQKDVIQVKLTEGSTSVGPFDLPVLHKNPETINLDIFAENLGISKGKLIDIIQSNH